MIKFNKNTSIKWSAMVVLALVLLTGCTSEKTSTEETSTDTIVSEDASGDSVTTEEENIDTTTDDVEVVEETKPTDTEEVQPADATNSFVTMLSYLGLNEEELLTALNEEPTTADESGMTFENAGITIWYDQTTYTVAAQVFTQRKDIDFNGAKIGDSIDVFKTAFGEPVSDNNGDMHFKYAENQYVSVNYDTTTMETVAVYLLSEDF